jgi:hypothetical protein
MNLKFNFVALIGSAFLLAALVVPIYDFYIPAVYHPINFSFFYLVSLLSNGSTAKPWAGFLLSPNGLLFDLSIIVCIAAIPFGIAGMFLKKPNMIACGLALLSIFTFIAEYYVIQIALNGFLPPVLTEYSYGSFPLASPSLFPLFLAIAGTLFYFAYKYKQS